MAQAFLVAWTVKNLPAMQETWVQSLDRKDPLEKGIASHSSIFTAQGSNPCLLHWQVDSLLLSHLGSPLTTILYPQ